MLFRQRKENHRKRIIVNVLNIVDTELAGAAIYAKNILRIWLETEHKADILILYSSAINVHDLLQLPRKANVKAKKVTAKGFVSRILYEQLMLPFVVRPFDVYVSFTQVIPFLAKISSPKTRLIITIHDMIPFFIENKYSYLRTKYVKFISRWSAILADKVIVVSQSTLKDVIAITKIPLAKLQIVYNFLTTDFQRENLNNEYFLLCISTVEPGKNLENTLEGYKRFLEKYKLEKYKFYWIGKIGWGYTNSELKEKLIALQLQDHFYFVGYLDEKKKQTMLRDCTACVYLSHYEGFGIPVLEGLYYNKPALVSNSSSLPEVIGDAGVLCDNRDIEQIADGMYQLIVNIHKYRSQIPKQIVKFDKDNQLRKFLDIIHAAS